MLRATSPKGHSSEVSQEMAKLTQQMDDLKAVSRGDRGEGQVSQNQMLAMVTPGVPVGYGRPRRSHGSPDVPVVQAKTAMRLNVPRGSGRSLRRFGVGKIREDQGMS